MEEKMEEKDLLKLLKLSIGDLGDSNDLDEYYQDKLDKAKADLESDDIDKVALDSVIGQSAIVLYATLLIKDADIATNPTLNLFKNKLSCMTKGNRIKNG